MKLYLLYGPKLVSHQVSAICIENWEGGKDPSSCLSFHMVMWKGKLFGYFWQTLNTSHTPGTEIDAWGRTIDEALHLAWATFNGTEGRLWIVMVRIGGTQRAMICSFESISMQGGAPSATEACLNCGVPGSVSSSPIPAKGFQKMHPKFWPVKRSVTKTLFIAEF
jgi:hypothetical protein